MSDTQSAARVHLSGEGITLPSGVGWLGATTIGYAIGMPLSMFLLGTWARPLSPVLGGIVYVLLFGAVIGLCVGCCQFLVMPRGLAPFHLVIFATLVGASLGFAVAAVVGDALGNMIDPTSNYVLGGAIIQDTSGAIIGLGVGFAQWLVLRRHLRRAGWWLAASIIGLALGYAASVAVLELFDLPLLKASLGPSFGVIVGVFVGLSQAIVLWSNHRV